jgi:hypothetical protein
MTKYKIIKLSSLPKIKKSEKDYFNNATTFIKCGDNFTFNPMHFRMSIRKDGWIDIERRKKNK